MTMSGRTVFESVGSLVPGRSVFDLSYEKKLTCDMGQLIPVMCDEVVPGDYFEIGNQAILRFQPLVAPVLHEINMYVHYFFVPYRLLWEDWEDFISGGVDGQDASVLPRWTPTINTLGSLWDFLGFPVGVTPTGALPMSFPRDAYNFVYNEYYRDETLQTEVALTQEAILNRSWEKDYFTSSLPWQQRGTSPALPITGTSSAVWNSSEITAAALSTQMYIGVNLNVTPSQGQFIASNATNKGYLADSLNRNTVDLSTATPLDIADLRIAFQIQRWMERNARSGARYTEFLKAHFGVSPRDERLQRPEYIGGSKSPIIISEVLQTSQTDTTPQGTLAGHGISISDAYCGKYHAKEYGLIIGIMSVMPRSAYQQGINRQWLRRTKYDFFFPEFANLSEQAIETAEIYATAVEAENTTLFGYQGRYDEMRVKQSMVVSEMASTFDYWHLGRQFAAAPILNDSFITCVPRKDIFADQADPGLLISFGNIIKAHRPLPITAEPGLIDHD
nr:MAG: major capsid protein [Microvirus sp.]